MISSPPGAVTSPAEITAITAHGFWLLVNDREYFVPFPDYPVFQRATVAQIYNLRQIGPDQLHWPELDADIELDALERPREYPLRFR